MPRNRLLGFSDAGGRQRTLIEQRRSRAREGDAAGWSQLDDRAADLIAAGSQDKHGMARAVERDWQIRQGRFGIDAPSCGVSSATCSASTSSAK